MPWPWVWPETVHMPMTPHVSSSGSPMTQKKPRFSWPKRIVPSRMMSAPTMRPLAPSERQKVGRGREGVRMSEAEATVIGRASAETTWWIYDARGRRVRFVPIFDFATMRSPPKLQPLLTSVIYLRNAICLAMPQGLRQEA